MGRIGEPPQLSSLICYCIAINSGPNFISSLFLFLDSGIREPLCQLDDQHLLSLKEALTIGKINF